jgi:phospholipid/cholesterol/gamma-HCH transport system permease protein
MPRRVAGMEQPVLNLATSGAKAELRATGAWVIDHGAAAEESVLRVLAEAASLKSLDVDASGVTDLDTSGALLLHRLQEKHPGAVSGLKPEQAKLLARVARAIDSADAADVQPEPPKPWNEEFGDMLRAAGQELGLLVTVLGAITTSAIQTLARPLTFRLTSLTYQFDRVGWQAVPLVALICFLVGCIIAQQGFFHFRRFGAEDYVVDLVGILTLREIAVLLVTIMVAGRSGSSYSAELGAMKMREELDALKSMGMDPVSVLMLPRVLALMIAVPILTLVGMFSGLLGGAFVASTYGGMSPEIFLERLREAISVTHFEVGMIKAPFMALVIGIVACAEGIKVEGSAESLGRQTTSSVVKSIFMVIVLDGLFAVFFASIGM